MLMFLILRVSAFAKAQDVKKVQYIFFWFLQSVSLNPPPDYNINIEITFKKPKAR